MSDLNNFLSFIYILNIILLFCENFVVSKCDVIDEKDGSDLSKYNRF